MEISSLLPDILFYVFSSLAILGAGLVILNRSPMHCAVSLVVSVLSIAILYLLLSAHFIAAAQMIVYAGAIVVLFIFVIMLLNLSEEEIGRFRFSLFKVVGAFAAIAALLAVAPQIRSSIPEESAQKALSAMTNEPHLETYGGARAVGRMLFGEFLLPFELTSILILAAMVAGVVLAKKDLTPKKTHSAIDWVLGMFK